MPYFVMETLHTFPGCAGLFVCCVFSAALSTLSSGFNALAAVTWDDILSKTRLSKMSDLQVRLTKSDCLGTVVSLLTHPILSLNR